MSHVKKLLNKRPYISIKRKLLGSYLLILIIPILLVGVYLTMSIRDNLISNKMAEIENNNERIRSDYVSILSSITRVSDWIYQDEDLVQLVNTEFENPFQVYQAYSEYQMFEDYLRYYDEIEHIRFFVDNKTLTSTTGIYVADESVRNQTWYQESLDKRGQISWYWLKDHITNQPHLNLVRAVYTEGDFVGVLAIAVNDSMVDRILADSLSSVFITLDSQSPVYSYPKTRNITEAYRLYQPILDTVRTEQGNYETIDNEQYDTDFTLNIRDVSIPKTLNSNMQVIGIVPTDSILEDVNQDLKIAYVIVGGVLVLSILILIVFIRAFNTRIVKLKETMSMVANGNFSIEPSIKGNDELSDVYKHLVKTTDSIENLIVENYEHAVKEKNWQLQLKDSQFKMLASQINPHFLYNTLEMIRMKALKNKDKEVADIITLLSRLMRKSLEGKQQDSTLSEELQFIDMYLQIQKLRFGDQIDYTIVNKTEEDYKIIPLIIQPLVENSFIHGIEPKLGKGIIEITVDSRESDLIISIKDNGIGMEKAQLDKIRKLLNTDEDSEHLGISNVHHRIKYYYGDIYGLEIESLEGNGTLVTVHVPKLDKRKEGEV